MLRRLLVLTLTLLVASCKLPPIASSPAAWNGASSRQGAASLSGRVESAPRRVQASFDDIASGATVSLIDAQTGNTLGTTVSDADGRFVMAFGTGFKPAEGHIYYLEAFKGLRGTGSEFNQVGADLARLRNVVIYQADGWASLLNAAPSLTASITRRTTALSTIIALKAQAGEAISYSTYMGALEPATFAAVGGITPALFAQAYDLVGKAIEEDRDPIQYTAFDTNTGTFLNAFIGFGIGTIAPTAGNINTLVTIDGNGFASGSLSVAFNGTPAAIESVTDSRIVARVLPGSRTGPVTVKIGNTLQAGPTFTVRFNDGHRALLNDKLYAANPSWDTLAEIDASGEVKTLQTFSPGSNPSQVAVGPDNLLYVAMQGSNEIRRLAPSNPGAHALFASVASPSALAFDTNGKLYVTSRENGTIVRLGTGGAPEATVTGFDKPRAIAFDHTGDYYVSEARGVYKLSPNTLSKASATLWGVIGDPGGLAVDSAGDVYVASSVNNAVYRIGTDRGVYSHLMTNKPGSLCFDEKGNLYVSDSDNNLIRRVSPLGDSLVYAYGISSPRGLAVDPLDGTLYIALSQGNAVLKVVNGVLKRFVTGIANPQTLKFRGNGLFIAHPFTHSVSYALRDGQLSTVASGLTYPGGVDQAVSGATLTGPLYVGRFGEEEDPALPRPPSYPSSWGPISNGDVNGLDVVTGGSPTRRRTLYEQQIDFMAIDSSKTIYAVRQNGRTLTMISYTAPGNGSNTSRQIRQLAGPLAPSQFPSDPGYVAVDGAGNVYVVVSGIGKIYRFKKSADYAKEEISGFNRPWGLAFSDTGKLYVSDYADGVLRRISAPDTATGPDAGFSGAIPAGTRGITYRRTGAVGSGTGTLYLANSASVEKFSLTGDTLSGAYQNHYSGLPSSITTIHTDSSGNLYAYANATYAYKLSSATPPVRSNYIDMTGWARLRQIAFDPSFALYRAENNYNGLSTMNSLNTTRELELDGNTLYVASPDNRGGGGVLKIDLSTNRETLITATGRAFSLALDGASPGHDLYVGGANGNVYKVLADGSHSSLWSLGTPLYGLDIRGTTLWGVGANSVIYEMPIGGSAQALRYGLMEPSF